MKQAQVGSSPDCRKADNCQLRTWCETYKASRSRYTGPRKRFRQDIRHPDIVYEPGKCIACGTCIRIAGAAGEPLGLSFIGRGFDVEVGVPFERSIAEALKTAAAECARACPTGALAFKDAAARGD